MSCPARVKNNSGRWQKRIPAAIFIEQNDRCSYVNQAAEDLTGYKRDELLKMTFTQLLHPDTRGTVIEQLSKQVVAAQPTSRIETVLLTERRVMRRLDVATGIFNLNGQKAFLITALDITDLKAAQNEIQHLCDTATGLASYRRFAEVFDTWRPSAPNVRAFRSPSSSFL